MSYRPRKNREGTRAGYVYCDGCGRFIQRKGRPASCDSDDLDSWDCGSIPTGEILTLCFDCSPVRGGAADLDDLAAAIWGES